MELLTKIGKRKTVSYTSTQYLYYFLRIQSSYHDYQLGEVQISLRRGFDDRHVIMGNLFSYGNQISRIALHLDANHITWLTRRRVTVFVVCICVSTSS